MRRTLVFLSVLFILIAGIASAVFFLAPIERTPVRLLAYFCVLAAGAILISSIALSRFFAAKKPDAAVFAGAGAAVMSCLYFAVSVVLSIWLGWVSKFNTLLLWQMVLLGVFLFAYVVFAFAAFGIAAKNEDALAKHENGEYDTPRRGGL